MSREMKDSGIEWLGSIPKGWEVDRIKRAISSIKGGIWGDEASGDENDINCVRIADFDRNYYRVGDVDFTKRNIPKLKQEDYLLENGDLLIEKSGGGEKTPVGFVALYDKSDSAVYSNFTSKLTVNHDEADSNFLRYIFAALYEQGISFRSIKQTTGIQNLDLKSYLNEKVGYPSVELQKRIADNINIKTIEINAIIEKTKSTIEEYKLLKQSIITEAVTKGLDKNVEMKDSGIEWIGEIPKHWDVLQAKYIIKWKSEKNNPEAEVLSLYRDLGIIPKNSRDDNHNVTSLDTSGYKVVEMGDLVINKMKAWQGSLAVSEYEGIVSPAYHVAEFTTTNIFPKYFHHLMRNQVYLPEYRRLSTGMRIGQWDLSFDSFKNLKSLIPPMDEQYKIVNYIDSESLIIDSLIERKKMLLLELEQFKKSLIYEYVTGKKEFV